MDFTLGLITGAYAVIALIIFYVAYVIEVKLDLPAIISGQKASSTAALPHTQPEQQPQTTPDENNELTNISQARLRQLIESIISETLQQTPLTAVPSTASVSEIEFNTRGGSAPPNDGSGNAAVRRRHRTEHYFEPKEYQDLLATAVLNKIVDGSAAPESRRLSESTPNLSRRHLDANFHAQKRSGSSGSSSVDPRSSDCSYTDQDEVKPDSKIVHRPRQSPRRLNSGRESALSDYLASHMVPLPDLSSAVATESEEDDFLSVTSSALGEGTWTDNWLFKKKHSALKAANNSVSGSTNGLGMLVPAPKEDVRAQIGDKIADEVSDLSEMGSESEESPNLERDSDAELTLNERLLNKHLIGGQNTKLVLDELIDRASLISSSSLAEHEVAFTETHNTEMLYAEKKPVIKQQNSPTHLAQNNRPEINEDPTIVEELPQQPLAENASDIITVKASLILRTTSNTSTLSNGSTNTINSTNTKTITNITNNNEVTNDKQENINSTSDGKMHNQIMSVTSTDVTSETDESISLRQYLPGSVAEREHKKWHNAVDMPNNPYAPEALKKRISGSRDLLLDLPNISPSTEQNPIKLLEQATNGTEDAQNDDGAPKLKADYKRYSRDYYVNSNGDGSSTPKTLLTPSTPVNDNNNNSNGSNYNNCNGSNSNISSSGSTRISQNHTMNGNGIVNERAATTLELQQQPQQSSNTTKPTTTSSSYNETVSAITTLYQAVPAQVLEDGGDNSSDQPSSFETASSSLRDTLTSPISNATTASTSSSNDSDIVRVYDFKKQETFSMHAHEARMYIAKQQLEAERENQEAPAQTRPTDLALTSSAATTASTRATPTSPVKAVKSATPTALKFLQPKRKLIELSEFMSNEEPDDGLTPISTMEKAVIEEDVAQALPSVKVLALTFQQQSSQDESIWKTKLPPTPTAISNGLPKTPSTTALPLKAVGDDNEFQTWNEIEQQPTNAQQPLSLELHETASTETTSSSTTPTPTAITAISNGKTSPVPILPSGFLKNNIAFFEGLKSK